MERGGRGKSWGKGGEKGKGKQKIEERYRKDSGGSIGSSVGSLDSLWGKKREREEEIGGMYEEGRGGFKRSGKTMRSPEGKDKEERKQVGEKTGGMEGIMKELVGEIRELREEVRRERERREEGWRRNGEGKGGNGRSG